MSPLKFYIYLFIIFIASLNFIEAQETKVDEKIGQNSNKKANVNGRSDETSESNGGAETSPIKNDLTSEAPNTASSSTTPPSTSSTPPSSTPPSSTSPTSTGDKVKLQLVVDSYAVMNDLFTELIKHFNKYADDNNLNIMLEMAYFSDQNNTVGYNDYNKDMSLMRRNKYDIFAYDAFYISKFEKYLLELDEHMSKSYFAPYSSPNNDMLMKYNGHTLGFTLLLIVSVLFSNKQLLQRYGMAIPKTWDQLLTTAELIRNSEINSGNGDIAGYTALFPNSPNNENNLCSFYQLLYSYRENVDDPIPPFNSKQAREAVEKILEIRDRVSSNDYYTMPETELYLKLMEGKTIFSHFFSSAPVTDKYYVSVLPGKEEGINSSIIGGFNIGINKYISEKKLSKAIEVVKYFSSKDFQKEFIVKQLHYFPAMEELYSDPEVCSTVNCDFLNNVQYFLRPIATMKNYNDFSSRTQHYIHELLNGKLNVNEFLESVNDINKVYTIDSNSAIGIILLIALSVVICTVLGATCLIFIKRLKRHYKFFTTNLWLIYALGSILILCSILLYFDETTKLKCILRQQLVVNGYSLIFIPLIYKLLLNFPLVNKVSTFAMHNKFLTLFGMYFLQLVFTILFILLGSYDIELVNLDNDNKNFNKCVTKSAWGNVIFYSQVIYGILLYLVTCLLIFFEWNIIETHFDVRQFSAVIIIDGITLAILLIVNSMKIDNYILYNLLFMLINLITVIVNHLYVFIVRMLISHHNEKYNKSEDKIIGDMVQNNRYTNTSSSDPKVSKIDGSVYSGTSSNYKSKIIGLHFAKMAQNNNQAFSPTGNVSVIKNYSYESFQNSNASFQKGNSQSVMYDSYYRPS